MAGLKLGMVGAGYLAHFQTRAIEQVRGIDIAGITAANGAEALSEIVRQHDLGEGKVYPSVAELTRHVDAIAIFVPNFARVEVMEQIVDAVKQGAQLKGVVCEKPLARNVREARRLVDLAREARLKTAYYENQIFMKPIQTQMKQLAQVQKSMGPLALTRSAEEHGGPHKDWFWDPIRQGGGVLSDMGCHSIAIGWYCLTPVGKPLTFLQPVSISAETALLKWGLPQWREKLRQQHGVDYSKTPAEDFTTGIVTFRNPETGQLVKAQFTNSWMFDKQGLRLFIDGMGPGYAFEINTLLSSLNIFIGDIAADAVADAESALEKSTASRGLLAVQHNESDLYGYVDENKDMLRAFTEGRDGRLSWEYGFEITRLVMAAYLSAEKKKVIDLTDPAVQQELETYVPLIAQGRGSEVLFG